MRRGKKQNYNKNFVAHKEWMEGKRLGRRKQAWAWFPNLPVNENGKHPGEWVKL